MEYWPIHFPIPLALAVVAVIGYFVGRSNRLSKNAPSTQSPRDMRRARMVARELEKISWGVRRQLSKHHASLVRFKQHVDNLHGEQRDVAWRELCREAEEMLEPTMHLANEIAGAYEKIRQQSSHLMSLTEVRTDPLTGLSNRRVLDDTLASQFALMTRYESNFSIVLFDIDHFKKINDQEGHLGGDRMLQKVARLLNDSVRETDIVTRYGGEEFVVVMPQTDLDGACVLADRIRTWIGEQVSLTISGGVATALDGDTPESLLARADAALYGAKSAGRNCVFRHSGQQLEPLPAVESAGQV